MGLPTCLSHRGGGDPLRNNTRYSRAIKRRGGEEFRAIRFGGILISQGKNVRVLMGECVRKKW